MIIKELEQFRAEHNLSNDDLAKMLNTHPISWYRIKRTGKFSAKFLLNALQILPYNATLKYHQKRYKPSEGGLIRKLIARVTRLLHTDISIGD